MEIRRLNPVDDVALFEAAYQWLADSPEWRKQTVSVFSTLDRVEYLANTHDPGRVDVGVWDGDEFIAIVSTLLRAKDCYETNFEAKRGANIEVIKQACWQIKNTFFEKYGAKLSYTMTPRVNRAIIAMDKELGYVDNKVRLWKGAINGRPCEWVQLTYVD